MAEKNPALLSRSRTFNLVHEFFARNLRYNPLFDLRHRSFNSKESLYRKIAESDELLSTYTRAHQQRRPMSAPMFLSYAVTRLRISMASLLPKFIPAAIFVKEGRINQSLRLL